MEQSPDRGQSWLLKPMILQSRLEPMEYLFPPWSNSLPARGGMAHLSVPPNGLSRALHVAVRSRNPTQQGKGEGPTFEALKENMKKTFLSCCLTLATVAMFAMPVEASSRDSRETRVSGPISGVEGQRLRVSVAALGPFNCLPTCYAVDLRIAVYDADATDLEPIAELPWTSIERGRAIHLDYDFERGSTTLQRQSVVVRLETSQRNRRPGPPGEYTASIQVFEIATGLNQLWGDWYIIDEGR